MPQDQEIREVTLTAYALGELDGPDHADERAALEARLSSDALAQRQVEEVRAAALWISAELSVETAPGLSEIQHAAIERRLERAGEQSFATPASLAMKPVPHNWAFWGSLAASIVIVCTLMASVLPKIYRLGSDRGRRDGGVTSPIPGPSIAENTDPLAASRDANLPFIVERPAAQSDPSGSASADASALRGENVFVRVADLPLSNVPVTTAYPDAGGKATLVSIGRYLANGLLPPAGAVRTDELVNALPYHYPEPQNDDAIGTRLEVAGCPWDVSHRLLRIGLRTGGVSSTNPATLPSLPPRGDAGLRIQIEFNPATSAAYRLIGYDSEPGTGNVRDSSMDARPARSLESAESMTVLYEIIPTGMIGPAAPLPPPLLKYQKLTPVAETSHELATVFIRYRQAAEPIRTLEAPLTDEGRSFMTASEDFSIAAAAATLGLILRDSPYKGTASFDLVINTLNGAESKIGDEQSRLLNLAKQAKQISSHTAQP